MANVQIEKDIVMRRIETIKPYVRNPRKNNKTVDALVKIIPKVGFNVPLVIDENGVIVKGHARFVAAIRLGMTEVPCIITHADEEAIKADRIADNKISEFSEWMSDELMREIEDMDFDLSDIGLPKLSLENVPTVDELDTMSESSITEEQKEKMFAEFKAEQELMEESGERDPIAEEFGNTAYYKCVCDKCGYVMFIKEDEL